MFLLEASGKDPFLALSSFRRPAMALDSWLFLRLPNASPQPLLPSSYLLSVTLTWCLYKDPWDDIGPTWIIQDDFHVSRLSLHRIGKVLLPCQVQPSWFLRLGRGHLWGEGAFFHLPHPPDRLSVGKRGNMPQKVTTITDFGKLLTSLLASIYPSRQ